MDSVERGTRDNPTAANALFSSSSPGDVDNEDLVCRIAMSLEDFIGYLLVSQPTIPLSRVLDKMNPIQGMALRLLSPMAERIDADIVQGLRETLDSTNAELDRVRSELEAVRKKRDELKSLSDRLPTHLHSLVTLATPDKDNPVSADLADQQRVVIDAWNHLQPFAFRLAARIPTITEYNCFKPSHRRPPRREEAMSSKGRAQLANKLYRAWFNVDSVGGGYLLGCTEKWGEKDRGVFDDGRLIRQWMDQPGPAPQILQTAYSEETVMLLLDVINRIRFIRYEMQCISSYSVNHSDPASTSFTPHPRKLLVSRLPLHFKYTRMVHQSTSYQISPPEAPSPLEWRQDLQLQLECPSGLNDSLAFDSVIGCIHMQEVGSGNADYWAFYVVQRAGREVRVYDWTNRDVWSFSNLQSAFVPLVLDMIGTDHITPINLDFSAHPAYHIPPTEAAEGSMIHSGPLAVNLVSLYIEDPACRDNAILSPQIPHLKAPITPNLGNELRGEQLSRLTDMINTTAVVFDALRKGTKAVLWI